MSIKIDTLNKFKKYGEDYSKQGDNVDDIITLYQKALDLLTRENVVGNTKMQAVIGLDENDNPVFWDLEKDNLLSTCGCGHGAYLFGQDLALASLELRFDKSEFAYYVLSGDGANIWNTTYDEHCLGFWNFYGDGVNSPLISDNWIGYLSKLKDVLNKRQALSKEQLSAEPFLLFVITVPHLLIDNWDRDIKAIGDIVNTILDNGKDMRVALYFSEYESFVLYKNRCYYPFLNKFSAKLFGAGLDSYYRKNVRQELNIDSNLCKELKVLHEEMISSRKNKLFAPAYFIDGNNTKQKIHFANYFFTAIVGLNE
jgi:hypothetical protein